MARNEVELQFGDVVELGLWRPEGLSWIHRSVVTSTRSHFKGTFASAKICTIEDSGLEVLPTSGTSWPPVRKLEEEPWDLERIATAVQRGLGKLPVERVIEIYTASSLLPPVIYSCDITEPR